MLHHCFYAGGLRFFFPISREQTLKNDGVSVSLSNKKEHLTPDSCGSDPTSIALSPISRSSVSNDGLEVDFYYQFPDWGDQLLGAYMLFHGCTHAGDHWFTYPEERIISRCLLNKVYDAMRSWLFVFSGVIEIHLGAAYRASASQTFGAIPTKFSKFSSLAVTCLK